MTGRGLAEHPHSVGDAMNSAGMPNTFSLAQADRGKPAGVASSLQAMASTGLDAASTAQPADQLTPAAQRWVSQTFFGTLLKQMRESPFKSDLFSGGRGGQAFSTLYDQHLADRMARAAGRPLVNSIVRSIRKPQTPDSKPQTTNP